MSAHVVVRDLQKSYGTVAALRGASFDVARGEIFGLLGPNGAGKTTAVECIVGLREADAGEIAVGGVDVRRQPHEARQRIGVALQSTALPDQITPREALGLFGAFYRQREMPAALLERFALEDKAAARFATLSGGQRQRLALALAFVNRPELVLLDEPTTGLDPQARRELHEEIRRMKRDGHTVLLTTHDLQEAEQLCDRIAILDGGRTIATGAPRELIAHSNPLQAVVLVTTRPVDRAQLARLPGVQDVAGDGATASFRTGHATQLLARLGPVLEAAGAEIVELHVRKATLEEVFLGITGARRAAADRGEERA